MQEVKPILQWAEPLARRVPGGTRHLQLRRDAPPSRPPGARSTWSKRMRDPRRGNRRGGSGRARCLRPRRASPASWSCPRRDPGSRSSADTAHPAHQRRDRAEFRGIRCGSCRITPRSTCCRRVARRSMPARGSFHRCDGGSRLRPAMTTSCRSRRSSISLVKLRAVSLGNYLERRASGGADGRASVAPRSQQASLPIWGGGRAALRPQPRGRPGGSLDGGRDDGGQPRGSRLCWSIIASSGCLADVAAARRSPSTRTVSSPTALNRRRRTCTYSSLYSYEPAWPRARLERHNPAQYDEMRRGPRGALLIGGPEMAEKTLAQHGGAEASLVITLREGQRRADAA